MPSYKLHAPEASFRAFAALIAAEYNEIDVEVSMDLSAASLSPTGKLPLLEITKDVTTTRIFSSHAIARYLAGIRRDTGLMGNSMAEQAAIDAWIDFSAQDLELPACVWFYPVAGYMPFSADAYAKAKTDLATAIGILENHLAKTKTTYLVGDEITLADIVVASTLIYPFKLVCDKQYLGSFGKVKAWFSNCVAQDEFRRVIGQVTMCSKETMAPGQTGSEKPAAAKQPAAAKKQSAPAPAPAPAPSPVAEAAAEEGEPRRLVAIAVKPCDGVDPQALYTKIKETITSQPNYNLKWDDACKVDGGKIYASFTIHLDADFDEEVMEYLEMMEDEVAGQEVTFMNAME